MLSKAFDYVNYGILWLAIMRWMVGSLVCIRDRIWDNVHSSHIRFCTFKGSSNMIRKTERSEIYCTDRGIVALQSLEISCLSNMYCRFYESSKLKKWMLELCTRFRKSGHIYGLLVIYHLAGVSKCHLLAGDLCVLVCLRA